jgi:APA family basic amino acid/polyamine antiporter
MRRQPSDPFARKPIETLIKEMEGSHRLHRVLGPVALTALGVGATIGTGLFVLTGEAAFEYAGPSLMLSFLLAGFGCGMAALCYSELASMVPVAGSAYTYAYATLGQLIAWIIGWDLILEYAIGSAAVAVGWSNYLDAMLQSLFGVGLDPRFKSSPWDFDLKTSTFFFNRVAMTYSDGSVASVIPWFNLPGALIVLAITVVLVIGIRESARFNATMVILNVAIIVFVVSVGIAYVRPGNWTPFFHKKEGWEGVAKGAGRIFFAYIGFDSISTHAEEAKNPRRDLAIGILASLVICTVLYVAATAVLTGMVPYEQIDTKAPFSAVFRSRNLPTVAALVTLGILAGTTSSLLVGLLSQPRILLAMARDGLLPEKFFGAVHPRFATPWKSTMLVGGLVALASALAPLNFLADLVSVGTLFAFLIVCAAVLILRFKSPEIQRPFRTPVLPLVAGLGILVNGGLMLSLGRDNWIRLGVWLAIGLVIYFVYGRYHAKIETTKPDSLEELA